MRNLVTEPGPEDGFFDEDAQEFRYYSALSASELVQWAMILGTKSEHYKQIDLEIQFRAICIEREDNPMLTVGMLINYDLWRARQGMEVN